MPAAPCADFTWNSGSGTAAWYYTRSFLDNPCEAWIDVSCQLCNSGDPYDITVTIPWDDLGMVGSQPPADWAFGCTLDINGSVVASVVRSLVTGSFDPIVLSGSVPGCTTNEIRIYMASGGTTGGAPNGYQVFSNGDLTITPLTPP